MNYNLINYAIGSTTFAGIKNNLNSTVVPAVTDDSAGGYSVGSVWINSATNTIYIATSVAPGAANWVATTGGGGGTLIQDNFTAAVNPAATNDSSQGYAVGSHWVNTATNEVFVCASSTIGAAVWTYVSNPSNAKVNVAVVAPAASDNLSGGYAPSSMWVDTVASKVYVCLTSTNTSAVWIEITNTSTPLLNPIATLNPIAANDSTQGYGVGSIWVNATTSDAFIALDVTVGAAVWKSISNVLSNTTAIVKPTSADDSSLGYGVSSLWFDTFNSDVYICLSSTVANAVWLLVSPEVHNAYAATIAPTPADDVSVGFDIGSVWVVSSADNAYICTSNVTANAVWVEITKPVLHNLTATTSPAGTNDASQSYAVTSLWINTINSTVYMCTASTLGAAVWVAIGSTFTASNQSTSILIRTNASPTIVDDVNDGYMPGSIWVNTSLNLSWICLANPPGAAVWQPIGSTGAGTTTPASPTGNNLTATTDPTATDDGGAGYAAGSFWINTSLAKSFINISPAVGAAIWHQIDAAGGSAITNNYTATVVPATFNSAPTYSVGSQWIDNNSNVSYICVDSTVNAAIWVETSPTSFIKNNLNSTFSPSSVFSSASGYSIGSVWIDTNTNKSFICVDSTPLAAVWQETSPTVRNNFNASLDPISSNSGPTYAIGSMWVNAALDRTFVCVNSTPGGGIWHQVDFTQVHNFSATTAPTSANDNTQNYTRGSRWLNIITGDLYFCTSDFTGAATWVNPGIKNKIGSIVAPTASNDILQGYQPSSLWVSTVGGITDAYVCTSAAAGAAVWLQLTSSTEAVNNLAATVAPSATNDTTQGYSVSSHWYNSTTKDLYICTDATTAAAVWVLTSDQRVNNYVATVNPSLTDDASANYEAGSFWYVASTSTMFVCASPTVGAAIWVMISSLKDNLAATAAPTVAADSASGYSVGSTWIDVTNDKSYICVDSTAATAIWHQIDKDILYNLTGVVGPTATDDSSAGYTVNSHWYNTVAKDLYICTDATATAAVWVLVSNELKSNYTATVDPTFTNDASQSYEIGSFWVNTVTNEAFICTNSTTGSAVWKNPTQTATPASTFDIINITSTLVAGTSITAPTVGLGASALLFNGNTVIVLLNGFEQVKGTDVIWLTTTTFSLSVDVYAGDVITVKP